MDKQPCILTDTDITELTKSYNTYIEIIKLTKWLKLNIQKYIHFKLQAMLLINNLSKKIIY